MPHLRRDPDNNFFPSPGKILSQRAPSARRSAGRRSTQLDRPVDYDPCSANLSSAADRALQSRDASALDNTISGIKTMWLFPRIPSNLLINGKVHTRWLTNAYATASRDGVAPECKTPRSRRCACIWITTSQAPIQSRRRTRAPRRSAANSTTVFRSDEAR